VTETTYADQQGAVPPVDRIVTVLFLVGLAVLAPTYGSSALSSPRRSRLRFQSLRCASRPLQRAGTSATTGYPVIATPTRR
jgi:hypothetical protein